MVSICKKNIFVAFKGKKKSFESANGTNVLNSFYDFTFESMIYLWRVRNSCWIFWGWQQHTKVGSWQLKFINSWMSWSEHKTIFNLIYVNSFDKICTLNIIYMSYRWKIGKNFAQKMIINTKTDRNSCQGYQKNKESKVVKWFFKHFRFTYHPLRQL